MSALRGCTSTTLGERAFIDDSVALLEDEEYRSVSHLALRHASSSVATGTSGLSLSHASSTLLEDALPRLSGKSVWLERSKNVKAPGAFANCGDLSLNCA